ncbi:site-specific integrase [Halomicronema sp. CCY15110]|uniref:site-specific integrase n=1 Tax=Halomicronema sp. CCY15110 TaxID=2767773 RepID=UPI001EF231A0|nr:site-specific integrase [Halomicronema sp. CCY15110]
MKTMHSSSSTKASKGSVKVINSNNRLQLRFRYAGKRHYLSMGLPDTTINRKAAEAKARQIELDIVSGNFDETLDKYKPQSALSTAEKITPEITPEVSLKELWEAFLEFKRPQCSENTMKYTYGVYTGYLEKLPTHSLKEASQIRDHVLQTVPLNSAKRFITRLSACCKFAMKSGLADQNPFDGMAAEIKLPKASGEEGFTEIDPFSIEERDAILQALRSNQFCSPKSAHKHSYYAPLIEFLFATGCRPSEAVVLQWKHVTEDFSQILFEQALINTDGGRKIRKGLKTQERRRFPCNAKLQELLKSIKPEEASSDAWVFPSPKKEPIDLNNFRNRTWKKVLKGLGIEYRKIYQTRHTFITHALETGKLDAKDVARLVGNSPEVIYQHYAGNKRELVVPEF